MEHRVEYNHPLGTFWGEVLGWSDYQGTDVTYFIRPDHDQTTLHVVQGSAILKD